MKSIISIVTPSYNQGQFIERTIQSVLSQKGDFYIDYIILDSASKDETVNIIKKYENLLKHNCTIKNINNLNYYIKKNNKFLYNNCLGISYRWVSKKDKGQVDAIINGFKISRGAVLNWLNSDDTFFDDSIFQTIIKLFNNDPKLDLISGDGNLIDENDNLIGQMIIPEINLKELIYLDYHVLQPSTFITKDLYIKNKKYLDINMCCAFDAMFYTHIINQKIKYLKLKKLLSCYRFYPNIKTLSLSQKRFREQMQVTFSISKNPLLILLSLVYRYFEIILRFKIKSKLFQTFFLQFKKFCYLIITGKPDRNYG